MNICRILRQKYSHVLQFPFLFESPIVFLIPIVYLTPYGFSFSLLLAVQGEICDSLLNLLFRISLLLVLPYCFCYHCCYSPLHLQPFLYCIANHNSFFFFFSPTAFAVSKYLSFSLTPKLTINRLLAATSCASWDVSSYIYK